MYSIHREKRLAYLLRHDHDYAFDIHGWRLVSDLVEYHGFTREELECIVANSSKQRFEFSEDGLCIRARQGHSINVDVELEEAVPPEYLVHGTVEANVPAILAEGLKRMSRQQVHLSADVPTAHKVGGRRKGTVVILRIASGRMASEGHRFWLSRNQVWLVESVPPQYIER